MVFVTAYDQHAIEAFEAGAIDYLLKPVSETRLRKAVERASGLKNKPLEIANDIAYGLGAGVWTQSLKRAHTMAGRIKAGTVWINTYRAVSFLMPFGGYKASGLGRENGVEAIDGYLQSKSVWINNGPGGGNPFIMKTAS